MATYPASAREAFLQLHTLSEQLFVPALRPYALAELHALAGLARDKPEGAPLRLTSVGVAVGAAQARLELLLLPSLFAPEAWAHTFLEGLLKIPLDEYAGKRLVEVGAGSGWICLALARFTRLARVHGVDLNPHAAPVAWCNAWLNGDEALMARLSFGESDLLRHVPEGEPWDFVVGCLSQEVRVPGEPPPEQASPHVDEEHFGLGLIARLLDEVPERLAPQGRLLLNLAGRPGRPFLQRMFTRRGFIPRVRVARRVMQAADTDLSPLVALEQRTDHAFAFFMGPQSPEPLRAATARGWREAGHPLWHEVAVWEARLALPAETLALRAALDLLGMPRLQAELDLSAASPEQLGFVAALAERLARAPRLPQVHEAGDMSLRQLVAHYLGRFFELRLAEDELFVAPEREQAVYSLLLATCDEGDGVLVSQGVLALYQPVLAKAGVRVTVTPDTLGEIQRLLGAFDAKVVLLSVGSSERVSLAGLRELLAEAERRGVLVVLDVSAAFTLSAEGEPRTLFEFLAREPYPAHLVVLYGLIQNAVYPDWELTLLLPVSAALRADLEVAAEVTSSRLGTLVQWFYERAFAERLTSRIAFDEPSALAARRAPLGELPRSRRIAELATHPAFAPPVFRADDPELVRLDFENEAHPPPSLIEGLVVACAAPHDPGPQQGLARAVASFLLETRGVRYAPEEIVLAPGVGSLMHHLGVVLRQGLGRPPRVFGATPCEGLLSPTWEAAGAEVHLGPLSTLGERRGARAPDVVVISQPSQASGRYLSHEELVGLATFVVEQRCLLVSDELFGLLNLSHPTAGTLHGPVSLEATVPGIGARTVVLGGLSKEFAAGDARVGWMAMYDRALAEALRRVSPGVLYQAPARAASRLYEAWARGPEGRLLHPERHQALREFLAHMRRELAGKRALLAEVLPGDERDERSGTAEVGGLSLAPRMEAWLGRDSEGVRLTPENLPAVVYARTHVVLNGGAWCGDPERVRAVFSLPREVLLRARERLRAFAESLR